MDTIEEHRKDLESRGYVEVTEYGYLKPGARIRHRGHQWFEATDKGTATVVAVYMNAASSWSKSWDMPDVEVIPQKDTEAEGVCYGTWAQYHCAEVIDLDSIPEKI